MGRVCSSAMGVHPDRHPPPFHITHHRCRASGPSSLTSSLAAAAAAQAALASGGAASQQQHAWLTAGMPLPGGSGSHSSSQGPYAWGGAAWAPPGTVVMGPGQTLPGALGGGPHPMQQYAPPMHMHPMQLPGMHTPAPSVAAAAAAAAAGAGTGGGAMQAGLVPGLVTGPASAGLHGGYHYGRGGVPASAGVPVSSALPGSTIPGSTIGGMAGAGAAGGGVGRGFGRQLSGGLSAEITPCEDGVRCVWGVGGCPAAEPSACGCLQGCSTHTHPSLLSCSPARLLPHPCS